MSVNGFILFETALGVCGLAWRQSGVIGVLLPEVGGAPARSRLRRRFPDLAESEPPPEIEAAKTAILALLSGEPADLTGVRLDLSHASAFEQKVYAIARAIPPGQVMTYGEIAERLGDRLLARDVGQAMGRNPCPIIVPCHRVLGAGGRMTGFSAPGGVATKAKMLAIEGYYPGGQPSLFG